MPGRGFIIFWICLLFFSEFSYPGRVWTELGTKIFVFTFSAYLIPFWLKIMPGRGFIIFWIFLLSFWEFSCPGRVWTELGTKFFFFSSFSAYLISFWLKIILGRGFSIFLLFFFEIFLHGSSMNGIRDQNFFFSLSRPISSHFG